MSAFKVILWQERASYICEGNITYVTWMQVFKNRVFNTKYSCDNYYKAGIIQLARVTCFLNVKDVMYYSSFH